MNTDHAKLICYLLQILGFAFVGCQTETETRPNLVKIDVQGVPSQVVVGTTFLVQLSATGTDQNGGRLQVDFIWSSSDEAIASVNDSGLVTIFSEGTVTISAESNGIIGYVTFTVLPKPILTSIILQGLPAKVIEGITLSVQLIAQGLDQNNKPISKDFVWSSSDSTKASVNISGLVTIISDGSVTISAESNTIKGSVSFTIHPRPSFEMFVSSRATHSVKRYNGDDGSYIDDFVKQGSGGLNLTQEVAFGPDGNLYVSGRGNSAILKYDKTTGGFLGSFTSGYTLDQPTKMTFGPDGKLYVSQWGNSKNKVARFDAHTGIFIDEITNGLNLGMSHTWDEDGNLYVVSYGSKDVKKYNTSGQFIKVFTSGGNLLGPVNLWFGSDGNLYVVDWETGSVQVFDGTTGLFNSNFITGLNRAEGYRFDLAGNLYICDWVNNIINKYNSVTGEKISTFIVNGGLSQPNSIAIRYPAD